MRLAVRIRRARLAAGLTQSGLAAQLRISRGAVANWESAAGVVPGSERLQGIARVTGANFEWLATGRGAARFMPSLDDIPATDAEFVDDPLELRLLCALRAAPQRLHANIVTALEAQFSPPPLASE